MTRNEFNLLQSAVADVTDKAEHLVKVGASEQQLQGVMGNLHKEIEAHNQPGQLEYARMKKAVLFHTMQVNTDDSQIAQEHLDSITAAITAYSSYCDPEPGDKQKKRLMWLTPEEIEIIKKRREENS